MESNFILPATICHIRNAESKWWHDISLVNGCALWVHMAPDGLLLTKAVIPEEGVSHHDNIPNGKYSCNSTTTTIATISGSLRTYAEISS
ncbi:MAG: hypothetical protein WCF03_18020 [Nitrososphaeraceae archaeon]